MKREKLAQPDTFVAKDYDIEFDLSNVRFPLKGHYKCCTIFT